ncbi:MAG: glycosyltransferase [Myxococcales bacterium]|jgi:glycosyltransferase involved in cell wall biosynthesis|nr:glycosyltransferase [Myxococcales bacterium]
MTAVPDRQPRLSIVIPVFNEAALLESAVHAFLEALDAADLGVGDRLELILAENGSTDGTAMLVDALAAESQGRVRALHIGAPNYGRALREGILAARGTFVLCDEIDLCDLDFHQRALDILDADGADLVVGSKALATASDERPLLRRLGTRVINGLLRATLDFQGTDTHGLKAFRREALLDVVHTCVVDRDLFASELVLRASRVGKRVVELPVAVREKRRPTINLIRRVPNVLMNLGKLIVVIRVRQR